MSGVGFAVFFGAASCSAARSGALPPWLYWLGSVTAVLQVLGVVSLVATSGPLQAGGAIVFVAPLASFVWVAAASVLIHAPRRRAAGGAHGAVVRDNTFVGHFCRVWRPRCPTNQDAAVSPTDTIRAPIARASVFGSVANSVLPSPPAA
jgi:hypothetical protein